MSVVSPILSVIIVAYKSRDELPVCLAALPVGLVGRRMEVCVVNNSPGEGVAGWKAQKFPALQWIATGQNLGFGEGNNLGYQDVSGECVLFLNPDAVCNVSAPEHCWRWIMSGPGIGLVSPKVVQTDGVMNLACRRSIPALWDGLCRVAGLATIFDANRDVYLTHFGRSRWSRAKYMNRLRPVEACRQHRRG